MHQKQVKECFASFSFTKEQIWSKIYTKSSLKTSVREVIHTINTSETFNESLFIPVTLKSLFCQHQVWGAYYDASDGTEIARKACHKGRFTSGIEKIIIGLWKAYNSYIAVPQEPPENTAPQNYSLNHIYLFHSVIKYF